MNAASPLRRSRLTRPTSRIGGFVRLGALVLAMILPQAGPLLARPSQTGTMPPASVVAAISAATSAAVAASPGQAAEILAATLASTSLYLGKHSAITLAVTKQTVTAVTEKLLALNLPGEVSPMVRMAVAVNPWLEAEIIRAAIDAAPSLRSQILNSTGSGASLEKSSASSISKQINSIIDEVNAQAMTANPTTLIQAPQTPQPVSTPRPVSPSY